VPCEKVLRSTCKNTDLVRYQRKRDIERERNEEEEDNSLSEKQTIAYVDGEL
jgi:hypothetical protein